MAGSDENSSGWRGVKTVATAALLGLTGCATTQLAQHAERVAPGYSYSAAAGRLAFPLPPEELESALLETLNERGFDSIKLTSTNSSDSATISARSPDHRSVTIGLRPDSLGSEAVVRVGRFGDSKLSRDLLERTAARIGLMATPPPSAASADTEGATAAFSRQGVPDAVMLREQAGAGFQDAFIP